MLSAFRTAASFSLLGVATLLFGACAAGPDARSGASGVDAVAARGDRIAEVARAMVGVPYRYGGSDPGRGFDCSGLVFYSYSRAGLSVPRNSQQIFKAARKIALTEADAGDVVFFQDQTKLSHVGIYLGAGLFVHAPASGRSVAVASLDTPYYQEHLVGIGRLLPN